MIEERYCSYEVSNLLQEKGFNQECFVKYAKEACTERYYDDYRERMLSWTIKPGELIIPSVDRESYEVYGVMIPAPTHQMACDWLGEVHGIYITIVYGDYPSLNKIFWTPQINSLKEFDLPDDFYEDYDKYGEAVEAALKYVLKNLI